MENQPSEEWSKNERVGGLLTPPSFHMVDIKEITPIINKNWLVAICWGIAIFGITKAMEIFISQKPGFGWFVLIAIVFSLLAIVLQYILITLRMKALKTRAVPLPYQTLDRLTESTPTGDIEPYGNSTRSS